MNPSTFALSQDELNAHMLGGVMDATSPPGETAADARTRCAVIVEMFRTFEAANAMESMIACHCVALQFVLSAAMRDAGNTNMDPGQLTRTRASAMAISKTLHLWLSKYESIRTRNETRAAEARQPAGLPATPTIPDPGAEKRPPARQDQPPAMIPQPAKAPPPLVPPLPGSVPPGAAVLRMPDPPGPGVKEALLSSASVLRGTPPNGRMSVPG